MRIVFTGGPGSGKTVIIEKLQKVGYKVIDEPARAIISHYEKHTPELHPKLSKENVKIFKEALEKRSTEDYEKNEYGFFDRSAIDEIGYRYHAKIKISESLHDFAKNNKYDMVFFFPFWKEIYKNDNIRHESSKVAHEISKYVLQAYLNYGYDPLIVPKISIEHRLDYILKNIKAVNEKKS